MERTWVDCPRCGTELKRIVNHVESKGYTWCDRCERWVAPGEKYDK